MPEDERFAPDSAYADVRCDGKQGFERTSSFAVAQVGRSLALPMAVLKTAEGAGP